MTISLPIPSLARDVVPWGGSRVTHPAPVSKVLTLRYSTGLVTLNLSIVVMMIAGVVRKKRRMKRTTLITRQRIHHIKPRMERCSLGGRKRASGWLHNIEYQVWGFTCTPQPSLVNSTWGASPRLSPSQSDQTSSSARLGFSKNNSLRYRRSRWRGKKGGCTPFPLAGPLSLTELLTSRCSVGQERN